MLSHQVKSDTACIVSSFRSIENCLGVLKFLIRPQRKDVETCCCEEHIPCILKFLATGSVVNVNDEIIIYARVDDCVKRIVEIGEETGSVPI